MWRRLYMLLVLVRLYFALSPSYIHPDEHFQGPEIIAGEVFGYPVFKTWEFTSSNPIRSIFPFWIIYGWPLIVLKWLWEGLGYGPVPPNVAFYGLRTLMFLLDFILGDWAIHELLPIASEHRLAVTLVASSYVTWTYQAHTFSNSIETLVVLWCLVLIGRLRENVERTMTSACVVLSFLGILGIFNRITFPAFLFIPLLQLLPSLYKKPLRLPIMFVVGLLALATAITMDTEFYTGHRPQIRGLFRTSTITPINNLLYNIDPGNLAQHGLHPFWQHFVANLPQLLGPAFPLLFFSSRRNTLFWSGISGIAVLSCFRHQEARFLLPAVPLLLSSLRRLNKRWIRPWIGAWVVFNLLAGILFGVYHQGGVVPVETWIAQQSNLRAIGDVFWWKTYSPPRWLLHGRHMSMTTTDFMGIPGEELLARLTSVATCEGAPGTKATLLVAPWSATFLDAYTNQQLSSLVTGNVVLKELWRFRGHIGLDDLDFAEDGIIRTLQRVIGRRGLIVWEFNKVC